MGRENGSIDGTIFDLPSDIAVGGPASMEVSRLLDPGPGDVLVVVPELIERLYTVKRRGISDKERGVVGFVTHIDARDMGQTVRRDLNTGKRTERNIKINQIL